MNLNKIEFLIYSSHKTSTQSLVSILNLNKYKSIHCHHIRNLKVLLNKNQQVNKEMFIKALLNYININKKKLKIITIIRNPKDRLISSLFQSYHTDELNFKKKEETTINLKNLNELKEFYQESIQNDTLPGGVESIDELSDIINVNIISNLEKRNNFYYFNHNLFELYILDFNKLIQQDNLNYINNKLKTKCELNIQTNLSKNKIYYEKYLMLKSMISNDINDLIIKKYHPFYFNAFN